MKDANTLLLITLLIATLGMVLVVLGVLHGSLFSIGATVLAIGLFGAAAAGIYGSVRAAPPIPASSPATPVR